MNRIGLVRVTHRHQNGAVSHIDLLPTTVSTPDI